MQGIIVTTELRDETGLAVRRFLLRHAAGNDDSPTRPMLTPGSTDLEVAYAWDLAGSLADDPIIHELRATALADGPAARPTTQPDEMTVRKSPKWLVAGKAAAVAALLVGVGAFVPQVFREIATHTGSGSASAPSDPVVVANADGNQQQIDLADGSIIRLDARSRISIAYSETERRVQLLEGRAYFTVEHDRSRPFIVHTAGGETVDLGTRFVIDTDGALTRVSLIEGKVEVRPASNTVPVSLKPGEKASYSDSGRMLEHARIPGDPLDWTKGQLVFNDAPLAEVVQTMTRYAPSPIRIGKAEELRRRRVTGVFFASQSEGFARTLADALGLRLVKEPSGAQRLEQP